MKKILVCLFLLNWVFTVNGQVTSRQKADSLLKLVPGLTASTTGAGTALNLADFYIRKEGSSKQDLDSAAYFINKAKKLHPRFGSPWTDGYILLVEGRLADKNGKKTEGMSLVAKAVERLKFTGDTIFFGKACYELSRYYTDLTNQPQLAIRVSLVEKAIALLRQSPDRADLAADMLMLADLYQQQGKFTKSLEAAKLALAHLKSAHQQLQGIYILMCTDELWLGNYQQALTYGLWAITASEQVHEETGPQRLQIENTVSVAYYFLRNCPKSLEHGKTAMAIAVQARDTSDTYMIAQGLCRTYLSMHQPQLAINLLNQTIAQYSSFADFDVNYNNQIIYLQAYLQVKDYKKASPYFISNKRLLNDPRLNDFKKAGIYLMLETYEKALHNYAAAYVYLRTFSAYAEKEHNNFYRQNSYGEHAKLDSLTHDYRSAYFYTIRFRKLSDSLLNLSKNKQLQELEVVYKTKEKDNSIELLHQKAKLQDAELGKSRRTINETIAGICVLLIGGGFFVRHYNIRQKTFRIIGKQHAVITTKNEEILIKNKELEGLIQEKEYLLIEVHHRVKNNLHTVLSFLSLQSKYLKGEALAAIKISRQRIYAMSLIHQKLYMAEDIKTIDMKSYLEEFVGYFLDSFSPDLQIKFSTNIESLRLPVNKAIPVGLIINEAITNSAKYAFPANTEPKITLSLRQKEERIELIIKDNGIGIPGDVNQATYDSLGIKLIKGLCNDLDGTLSFESATGTMITILFRI
ncbi:histidine kinase dimerization/phosphoacceptor domain -containing protein [Mucilaginibacter sp. KACC 22773]|uniref:histidine kinase dimerization/phosphoacceptor domain -containing protein n=1 Tax=Mucilaginibacter sp. KACC 22773 TaxID=3025671 RepID=UPI0023662C1E|nr:histidine kinase dimerization/phosphoacceptor domain -containing protein [Mucilaginibacter sp. KACC 22773]WDF79032.1 histidine kinase dimerization/phosphoacceptor domain -containing protein [Mucilaginibacter sp. KACC 22773]